MRFLRLLSRPLTPLLGATFLLGASACSGTLEVGEPLPVPAPIVSGPAPVTTSPVLPPSTTPADTYAWQWINPSSTGVHLRAVAMLSPAERYFVGDGGTVVREVAGKTTVIRQGARDEQLSAIAVGSANDIWVGGAKGGGGILVHWDGKRWSEGYPVANGAPIDALQSGPSGGVFLVVKGHGLYMHPSGSTSAICSSLYSVRDVWVESPTVVWYVGDEGIYRQTLPDQICTKVDPRPSYGVWGNGNRLFVASRTSSGQTEVVERVGDSFVRIGAPLGELQQEPFAVRRGKTIAGDALGNPVVLLQSDRLRPLIRDSYAVFDPRTGAFQVHELEASDGIYGLASAGGEVAIAGKHGLHGVLRDGAPISSEERNRLASGMPARDGAVYASCTNAYDRDATNCQLVDGRWERLPVIPGYHSAAGVAAAEGSLWLGGFAAAEVGKATSYYALHWDGSTWTRGPEATTYMMRPLYASSANDVWAWSDYKTLHYDGRTWSVRATGGPGTGGFLSADGLGQNDVWLVDTLRGLSHWDGTGIRHVASLPPGNHGSELRHSVVADGAGVWMMAQSSQLEGPYVSFSRLLHWNGATWTLVELPGLSPRALSRGPDGKVRMVAGGNEGPVVSGGGTTATAVWVVSDTGVQKELDLPVGVELLDLFATKDAVYAVGEAGATLRFAKVVPTTVSR